jgi:hypothetical protein
VARLVVILALVLTATGSADARPAAGTRARIRAETWQVHRDRLVAAGKIDEARAVSRELARHYRRAGKPVEAEWARVFADQWKLERESQNRGPLLAVAPGRRLAMAEIEESLAASRARPGRRLARLAALYEQDNMLQEAAWALAEAGPAHAARARRLERRLERIMAGPVVALHPVVMDGRRLTLAEFEGGIFAVFKPRRETWREDQSAFPESDAYKIDRMLGLGLVPVSVARTGARAIDGQEGTLQYFFKYGAQLKRTAGTATRKAQTSRMRDLRTILSDPDGHNGNAFVLPAGRQAAIDAGQAFLWNSSLPRRLEDPALATALGAIDRRALRRALGAPLARRLLSYWQPLIAAAN